MMSYLGKYMMEDMARRLGPGVVLILWCLICQSRPTVASSPKDVMYVFGDSFGDTGNFPKTAGSGANPWALPYGRTWPGKAAGRFCDGRIMIDYLTNALELADDSIIPYVQCERYGESSRGINFARGGARVLGGGENSFTAQAANFLDFVKTRKYTSDQISKSYFLFVMSGGNDYNKCLERANRLEDYVKIVISGMKECMNTLFNAGARKFIITNVGPLGCFPSARNDKGECDPDGDAIPDLHNSALSKMVSDFAGSGCAIHILDMCKGFAEVMENPGKYGFSNVNGSCTFATSGPSCGNDVAVTGNVTESCANPDKYFFWDGAHLTQAGWKVLFNLFYAGSGFTDPKPNLRDTLFCNPDSGSGSGSGSGSPPPPPADGGNKGNSSSEDGGDGGKAPPSERPRGGHHPDPEKPKDTPGESNSTDDSNNGGNGSGDNVDENFSYAHFYVQGERKSAAGRLSPTVGGGLRFFGVFLLTTAITFLSLSLHFFYC